MISLFSAIRSPILTIPLSTNLLLKMVLPPIKVAEHSFAGKSEVTRLTACVLNYTNKHGGEKSNGTKMISQNLLIKFCNIWQNFYFYRILNNENLKMEVEQTNFVTHLIITPQLYN